MRKLSSYRGEEAVEVIANIFEPATYIMADKELREMATQEKGRMRAIKHALKHHKTEVLQIMAVLDEVDIEDEKAFKEYVNGVNFFTLPKNLLYILNDPDIQSLFISQGLMEEATQPSPASDASVEND